MVIFKWNNTVVLPKEMNTNVYREKSQIHFVHGANFYWSKMPRIPRVLWFVE